MSTDRTAGYLAALVHLMDEMVWTDRPDEAILQNVAAIKTATAADLAPVYLLDARQEFLRLVAVDSERLLLARYELLPASTYARLPLLSQTLEPVVIGDLLHHDADDFLPDDVEDELRGWMTNGAVVPLVADHRLLGILCLSFRLKRPWTGRRIGFLAAVGRILGNAVYHAQTAARLQELATLEERRLISRELHDGISQDLSALGLRAAAATESLAAGRMDELGTDLMHIADISLQVQKGVRDEMLGLRTPSQGERVDLVAEMKTYLDHFQDQWFLPVRFDTALVESLGPVPSGTGIQLLRIVQEALSNTRLHAGASSVTVRLSWRRGRLELELEDDGSGFDRDQVPTSRLGLRIMQERIEQVGGKLEIISADGCGTRVRVEVPLPA
ncbi:MAG: GAF domain-containing sensor histidine kinase [Candidatus Dormibacteria bacterium]